MTDSEDRGVHGSFTAGFLLYDAVTQLDLTGPLQVFRYMTGARTEVVARSRDAVATDCGMHLVPTATFDDCPDLDLICVPGGFGVTDAIGDPETMKFVSGQARRGAWVTSVCTGAFLLGAAGLLQGRRATTHWAYLPLLPLVGATPVTERTVRDGRIITGGGVTAGIDFALEVITLVAGDHEARRVQLMLEYAPAPPFGRQGGSLCGTSSKLRTELGHEAQGWRRQFEQRLRQVARLPSDT